LPLNIGQRLARLKQGLARTRNVFRRLLTAESTEELEELLLSADVGVKATQLLVERIRGAEDRRKALEEEIAGILGVEAARRSGGQAVKRGENEVRSQKSEVRELKSAASGERQETPSDTRPLDHLTTGPRPRVLMVVGVNGSGKTTTVGKLSHYFSTSGHKVVVAAADTYRDAAAEQLGVWAGRAGVEIVSSGKGQDAAAVVFDTLTRAASKGQDIVLVDTAGRLHTRQDLMAEVEKIKRVCAKVRAGAPDEVWLVLDATVGQNGLRQARAFNETLGLTGLIVAKLDGTAKAGILIPIALELGIPIRFIGTGEGIEDLEEFEPEVFAKALFEE